MAANRIERIQARAGGSGENGNGINAFRAGSVLVSGNRITDCAYSAIRGNAASNIQMIGNSCARIGEVALYAEFGFEGALIANNLVDGAASGIAVTNFNEGGRLAVVQGNIIRNLKRREAEPERQARRRHQCRSRCGGQRQRDRGRADGRHHGGMGAVSPRYQHNRQSGARCRYRHSGELRPRGRGVPH